MLTKELKFSRHLIGFRAFKSDEEFKTKAANTLFNLCDKLTDKFQEKSPDFIIDATDDSLSISMYSESFLLNRQVPSRQIWMASPISGSVKFDFDNERDVWVEHNHKDKTIDIILTKEVEDIFGKCSEGQNVNKI